MRIDFALIKKSGKFELQLGYQEFMRNIHSHLKL